MFPVSRHNDGHRNLAWLLSLPITIPPSRVISVHWGQENPEMEIEIFFKFLSALTCSWWDNRISDGTAGHTDWESKTPEKMRRRWDREEMGRFSYVDWHAGSQVCPLAEWSVRPRTRLTLTILHLHIIVFPPHSHLNHEIQTIIDLL